MFLKISQNSPEKIFGRVSFLKFQTSACSFIKKEALAQVFFCEFCEIFKDTFFYRTPPVAASGFATDSTVTPREGIYMLFVGPDDFKVKTYLFPLHFSLVLKMLMTYFLPQNSLKWQGFTGRDRKYSFLSIWCRISEYKTKKIV